MMNNILRLVRLTVELGHTVTVESENRITITRSNGNIVKVVRLPIKSGKGDTYDMYTQCSGQPVYYYTGYAKGFNQAVKTIVYLLSEMS